MNKDVFVIVMAGGIGSRFWPFSRTEFPKQFHDVLGVGKTMIQQTVGRFDSICPKENILVVTNSQYKDLVQNQIDYITIATLGNAIDFGDLTQARENLSGCSSSIRGCFGGGQTPTNLNTIDYVTIMSIGNAIDFGDMTMLSNHLAACSNAHGGL